MQCSLKPSRSTRARVTHRSGEMLGVISAVFRDVVLKHWGPIWIELVDGGPGIEEWRRVAGGRRHCYLDKGYQVI